MLELVRILTCAYLIHGAYILTTYVAATLIHLHTYAYTHIYLSF